MAIVTELVTEFAFEGDASPLTEFNSGMGDALGFIAKGVAGFAALQVAINAFVIVTLSGADAIAQLSITSQVGIEAIQELGFAASVSGSSVSALEGTIDSLTLKIGDAAQKGSDDFARLGISVRDSNGQIKTADVILSEVSKRFNDLNLSMQEQQSFASALGIDPSLVQLLGKTSEEMAGLRKQARALGVVTNQQADEIIAFNDSITTMKFGLSSIQKQLAIGLAPAIQDVTEGFIDFLVSNQDLIKDGIEATVDWIGYTVDALYRLLPILTLVAVGFIAAKVAALGFTGVMAILTAPITLWIVGITAAVLIIDDLITAFQGGKSVIGDFFQEFFNWDIGEAMRGMVVDIGEGIDEIKLIFSDMFDFIDIGFGKVSGIVSKVGGFLGIGDDETNISPGQQQLQTNITNNNIVIDQKNEIKTNDPEAAGRAVNNNLQEQLANADIQINQGGR